MNNHRFVQLIKDPGQSTPEEINSLKTLINEYPFSAVLRIVLAKISHIKHLPEEKARITSAAISTVDRVNFKTYLGASEWQLSDGAGLKTRKASEKTSTLPASPSGIEEPKKESRAKDKADTAKRSESKSTGVREEPPSSATVETSGDAADIAEIRESLEKPLSRADFDHLSSELLHNIEEYRKNREHFEQLLEEEEKEISGKKRKKGSATTKPRVKRSAASKTQDEKAVAKEKPADKATAPEEEKESAEKKPASRTRKKPAGKKTKGKKTADKKADKKKVIDEIRDLSEQEEKDGDEKGKQEATADEKTTGSTRKKPAKRKTTPGKTKSTASGLEKKTKIEQSGKSRETPEKEGEGKPKAPASTAPQTRETDDESMKENIKDALSDVPALETMEKVSEEKKAEGYPIQEEEDPKVIKKHLKKLEGRNEEEEKGSSKKLKKEEQEEIIENFIKSQPKIKKVKSPPKSQEREDLSLPSVKFSDNIISEHLALIMINQGKLEKAIDIYKKLIWKFPQKKAYFATQIEALKKKLDK